MLNPGRAYDEGAALRGRVGEFSYENSWEHVSIGSAPCGTRRKEDDMGAECLTAMLVGRAPCPPGGLGVRPADLDVTAGPAPIRPANAAGTSVRTPWLD